MKENGLIKGTMVLAIGAGLAKVFSAVYRIILTRILGAQGIGLYQLIFPIYSMCIVLSTTGLPMAVSKIISKKRYNETKALKYCFKIIFIISTILAIVLFLLSNPLADKQGDKRIAICFKILSPSLIVVGSSSILRGYFQGKMFYFPSAISQIVEQIIKMLLGLIMTVFLVDFGVIYALIGAVVAIFLSELASLILLLIYYRKCKSKEGGLSQDLNRKEIIKDIVPITLTNLIFPIATFVDSLIVVNLLSINFDNNVAISLYGLQTGAVNSIVILPTMFSFALASAVMPKFSPKNSNPNQIYFIKRLVVSITLPCVLIFIFAPNGILELLYGSRLDGKGIDVDFVIKKLLQVSAVGIFFLAQNQILSSYLQSQDRRKVTIVNMAIAVIFKFLLEIILLLNVQINVYALAIANTVCYFVVYLLNNYQVKKISFEEKKPKFWLKLTACSIFMLLIYWVVSNLIFGLFGEILAYFIAGISYLFGVYLLDVFDLKAVFNKIKKESR